MSKRTDEDLENDLQNIFQADLDPDRAYAVTDYLAENPERAAELLSDVRNNAALRMAISGSDDISSPDLVAEAHRLQNRLQGQQMFRRMAPVALACLLFTTGWLGNSAWQMTGPSGAPPLVEAALDAQAALEVRHWMVSQPESTDMNPEELVAALGFVLPPLPDGWIVRDVQIVATPDRPGVALVLDAPELGSVFLFAVSRDPAEREDAPTSFEYDGRSIAVFERGRSSFVLVDNAGHPDQLSASADQLLSRMN